MTITVYADELLRLTVDDLGDETLVVIKDQENRTEEHLAHLKKLAEERRQRDLSQPLPSAQLQNRLNQILSQEPVPSACRRSPSVSTVDSARDKEEGWQEEEEAYHALIAEGGRPSHPVTFGYDVVDNLARYTDYSDIISYWQDDGSGRWQEFRYQLMEWRRFKSLQERRRDFYIPRNRFQEYQNAVQESQADQGCHWNLRVLEDWRDQNRLEDWNELRAVQYRKREAFQRRIEPAERELSLKQKELEKAQAQFPDVVTDPRVLYRRLDEIVASREQINGAKSRVQSAEKALQAAKLDESKDMQEKAGLINTAQQALRFAQADLDRATGSEEMRKLRDGYELHQVSQAMLRAQSEVNVAQNKFRRESVYLKWIDDQYPAIAAECGYPVETGATMLDQPHREQTRYKSPEHSLRRSSRSLYTQPILQPDLSSVVPTRTLGVSQTDTIEVRLPAPAHRHRPKARSVLKAVESGVSKKKRRTTSRQLLKRDMPQEVDKKSAETNDHFTPISRLPTAQEGKLKQDNRDKSPPLLRPQRACKIVKRTSADKQLAAASGHASPRNGLQRNRQQQSNHIQPSRPLSVTTRSGRLSKRPDRFCPG